jgi:hypothetical protein
VGLVNIPKRCPFTTGHSLTMMLYAHVSRMVPFGSTWLFRNIPSSFAPSRSMARRLA